MDMENTWAYEDVVIAMIHEDWRNGDEFGLSAWAIWRRLKNAGCECSIEPIVSALCRHRRAGQLAISDDRYVPFRYRITRAGVTTGEEARTKILLLKQRRTALLPQK